MVGVFVVIDVREGCELDWCELVRRSRVLAYCAD